MAPLRARLGLIVLALAVAAPAAAAPKRPWDEPFGDPAAILEAADALPPRPGEDIEVLLEEAIFEVDAERRVHSRLRLLYRVVTADAVGAGGSVRVAWHPRTQDRAEVEARVLLPGGEVLSLDPSTLVEVRPGSEGDGIYRDLRQLEGPLPRLEPGAIVERVIHQRAHAPFFEAGEVVSYDLNWASTPRRRVVEVRAARGVPVTTAEYGLPHARPRKVAGGTQLWRWELGEAEDPEAVAWLPRDRQPARVVRFTTGRSWAEVAQSYAALVEGRLAGEDLAEEAAAAAAGASDPATIVRNVYDHVRRRVRYTGLEFGEAALVPAAPSDTLERGFGDCKDQSTLIVGLLRSLGIDASVALLDSTGWFDVDPALPGLAVFDHAIVRVPSLDLWLDPTDPGAAAGELRTGTEGRRALVARADTTGLVLTRRRTSADNLLRVQREAFLDDERRGRVAVRVLPRGGIAQEHRDGWIGATAEEIRGYLEDTAEETLGAQTLGAFEVRGADQPNVPFELWYEALETERAQVVGDEAAVALDPTEALAELASNLRRAGEDEAPRTEDVASLWPHRVEVETRVHAPAGFVLTSFPPDRIERAGPASFGFSTAETDDGAITTFWFELASGPSLRPDELGAVRDLAGRIDAMDLELLLFQHRSLLLAAEGRIEEALALVREDAAARPDALLPGLREAELLLAAGLPQAARAPLRALTTSPQFGVRAWRGLADACREGVLGEVHAEGWDRDCTLEALRALTEQEPDEPDLWTLLADTLEHDARGILRAPGADLAAAAAAIERAIEVGGGERLLPFLATDLGRAGDLEGLARLERRWGESLQPSSQVALRTILGGTEEGLRAARSLGRTAQGGLQLLADAYVQLLAMGHPTPALELLSTQLGPGSAAEAVAMVDILRDAVALPPDDEANPTPTQLYRRLFRLSLFEAEPQASDPAFGPSFRRAAAAGGTIAALGTEDRDSRSESLARMPAELLVAMTAASWVLEEERLAEDLVVVHHRGWKTDHAELLPSIVVAREPAGWRIVGPPGSPAIAYEVLRQLARGKVPAARRLLDLGLPLEGGVLAEPRPEETAQTIEGMALLAACPPEPADCVAAVRRVRQQVRGELEVALQRREARLLSRSGDLEGALGVTAEPPWGLEDGAESVRFSLLLRTDRAAEALASVEAVEERGGKEAPVLRIHWAARFGHLHDLVALEDDVGDGPALNELAWGLLFAGDPERAVAVAERGVGAGKPESTLLHTLAAAYAEADRPEDARRALRRRLALGGGITSDDWYVIGRVAEGYGAVEAARAAYARVDRPGPEALLPAWELAQRRLRGLP